MVAGRAGDSDLARDRMAEGDRLIGDRPWWGRLLRLLALESAVLDGWGDPIPTLRTELSSIENRATSDSLGSVATCCGGPVRRRVAAVVTAPCRRSSRSQGVTSREMDVLQLVAQGLSNAEVAGRLYLSPRTVDTHVASLLAKTGARRRGELRELMADCRIGSRSARANSVIGTDVAAARRLQAGAHPPSEGVSMSTTLRSAATTFSSSVPGLPV